MERDGGEKNGSDRQRERGREQQAPTLTAAEISWSLALIPRSDFDRRPEGAWHRAFAVIVREFTAGEGSITAEFASFRLSTGVSHPHHFPSVFCPDLYPAEAFPPLSALSAVGSVGSVCSSFSLPGTLPLGFNAFQIS